jgi:hypothetical protein
MRWADVVGVDNGACGDFSFTKLASTGKACALGRGEGVKERE